MGRPGRPTGEKSEGTGYLVRADGPFPPISHRDIQTLAIGKQDLERRYDIVVIAAERYISENSPSK